MSAHDLDLLDEAYSTTYKSTLRKLLSQAQSDECKSIIKDLIRQAPE